MEIEAEHGPVANAAPPSMKLVEKEVRPEPVEFKFPKRRAVPPTMAQHTWMQKNKSTHVRMSHARTAKFSGRGTLHPDGTFVPESAGNPVMDGNGCFGVGIVKIPQKRRR